MSILALNDGTFDISNNKLNVYESNVVLTQNYGINGGITEISSNMFNIINSNVNISRNNPYLGLNNNWTGKNLFNGDISFININTLINSLNTINLSSSAINISGGPVNIGAAKLASLDVSGNAAFNNSSTQINSTSVVGLSGGVVNISGGAVNINGGILNISGGQLNIGSALYMSNSSPVYLTNANTFGAGMMDLSRAYLGYGTASNNAKFICDNIGNTAVDGSGAFFVSSMNGAVISNNGLAVGKSTRSAGYALDVSGSVIINNGNVGIGITAPAYTLDVSGVISASNKNGNSGNGVQTFITSGNGSFGSIECTNSANTVKLPLCLQGYGGSVGIGMTNPLNNLDVSGTIKASSTIYSNNLLIQGDGTNAYIRPTNTNNSSLYLGSNDNNNNIMAINSAGNVGIGTMAPVLGSLLHLYKSGANYTTLRMENANNMLDIGTQNTGETFMTSINNYSMLFSTNNTERMRIDQTGKIGIGKINPTVALDVSGSLQLSNTAANVNTYITSHNGSFGSIECFGAQNTSKLPLILQGYGGNVGIGTTNPNPSNTLDVTGTIKASSNIYSNNLLLQGDGTNAYIKPQNGGSSLYIGGGNTNLVRLTNNAMIMGSAVLQVSDSSTYQTVGLQLNNTSIGRTPPNGSGFQFSMSGTAGWAAVNTFGIYSNGLNLGGGYYGGFPFVINGDNGRVGIGTTNPAYKLDVGGQIYGNNSSTNNFALTLTSSGAGWGSGFILENTASGSAVGGYSNSRWGSYVGGNGKYNCIVDVNRQVGILQFNNDSNYTAYFYGNVLSNMYGSTSDTRIKKNILDIDDEKALSILRKIQPKTYDYIDVREKGKYNVIGFIAQEIKEIIPNAITIEKKVIPNFMTHCQMTPTDLSNIVLVTSPNDLSWSPLHDVCGNAFVDASGNACSDASGNRIFNVRFTTEKKQYELNTTNVLDKRNFLIDLSSSVMSDTSGIFDVDCLLYGQEVDDFHYLDKSAIFTVVTAAVQEIDRIQQSQQVQSGQIQAQQVQIQASQSHMQTQQQIDSAKIESLQEQVNTLQSQLSLLQSQVAALLAK